MSDCKSYVSKEDLQALKESQQHIEHVARSRDAAGEKALQVTDPIRGENVTNRTLDGLEDLYTASITEFEGRGEAALSNIGWVTIDSFQQGAEITERNQVLRDETNGEYYRWDGDLPKSVPVGSTPESAGGVGMGAWISVGDAALRTILTSTGGADFIKTNNGQSVQYELSDISKKTEYMYDTVNFVKVTDYSHLVVDDDWTSAIQAALDTGKDVYGNGKYKVSGKLKSKGQRLIGEWEIDPTHITNIGKVKCNVTEDSSDVIRMIYMAVEYDLCALLIIKSLGFNMISHYTNFVGHPLGNGGTIDILLDNATTAGLKVIIDIDQGMEKNNLTMEQLISKCDPYNCVFGYSVYDEPGTRDISVEDQDNRLKTLRGLTGKCLTSVDLIVESNPPFYDRVSKNYDLIFVDSYAQRYADGTSDDHYYWDMEKSRLDVGGMKALSKCQNIIHVGGLFIDHSPNGQYTRNKQQGIRHVVDYCTKNGGNYGIFIWDMPWDAVSDDCVMNSVDYQKTCLQLSKQSVGNSNITREYIFGTAPNYADFGVKDLIDNLLISDPNNLSQSGWSDSYPCAVWVSENKYSGIAFKNETAKFVTTIPCERFVSIYFDVISLDGALNSGLTLQLQGDIGGSQRAITPEINVSVKPTFYNSSKWDGKSFFESLNILLTNSKPSSTYNVMIRGLIVCSDW